MMSLALSLFIAVGYQPALPRLRCTVDALVDPLTLERCNILDLQGGSVFADDLRAGNTTYAAGNETLHLLRDALASRATTPRVDALLLSGTARLGDDGLALLAPALRQRGGVTTLAVDACNLTSDSVAAVAAAVLFEGSPLRTLSLSHNPLGLGGLRALAAAVADSTTLRDLHLSGSGGGGGGGIGGGGGGGGTEAMMDVLVGSAGRLRLEHLALDQVGLGEEGALSLARALNGAVARGSGVGAGSSSSSGSGGGVGAPPLAMLDVSGNGVGEAGSAALAHALATVDAPSAAQSAPRELWFSSNGAGGRGASEFARAIGASGTMSALSLHDNVITRDGGEALARALRTARALTQLPGVRHNDAWPPPTAATIEAAVARNTDARDLGRTAVAEEQGARGASPMASPSSL